MFVGGSNQLIIWQAVYIVSDNHVFSRIPIYNSQPLPLTCTGWHICQTRRKLIHCTYMIEGHCRHSRVLELYNMYVIFYALVPNPSLESPPICIIQLKQRRIKQLIYVTSQWVCDHVDLVTTLGATCCSLTFSILVAWGCLLTRRMLGVIIDSCASFNKYPEFRLA